MGEKRKPAARRLVEDALTLFGTQRSSRVDSHSTDRRRKIDSGSCLVSAAKVVGKAYVDTASFVSGAAVWSTDPGSTQRFGEFAPSQSCVDVRMPPLVWEKAKVPRQHPYPMYCRLEFRTGSGDRLLIGESCEFQVGADNIRVESRDKYAFPGIVAVSTKWTTTPGRIRDRFLPSLTNLSSRWARLRET